MKTNRRHLRQRPLRRGAAAVEFAIVAPLLFLMILTMFEFSRLQVIRHTGDNAAYEAARKAMVPGATAAEAVAEANRIMRTIGARGVQVNVTPGRIDAATRSVTVEVQTRLDQNALVAPRFTRGAVLRSTSTLLTERVRTP
jgi:Flp pilus assembly protein TadG